MAKTLYTAAAHVTGGRADGHGKTSDGALEVDLRLPSEMGGQGGGTNPEQLFAVGYAACFEGAIGAVARRMKLEAGDVTIDSKVSLHPNESRGFDLSVELDVTLPSVEGDQAAELAAAPHHVCPYSNAPRGNTPVPVPVKGQQLDCPRLRLGRLRRRRAARRRLRAHRHRADDRPGRRRAGARRRARAHRRPAPDRRRAPARSALGAAATADRRRGRRPAARPSPRAAAAARCTSR